MSFITNLEFINNPKSTFNLNREGVFRINIGVSRATFDNLFPDWQSATPDYTALNVFLPHPDYAKQNFLCILNPSGENVEKTKELIQEAHSIAAVRCQRKAK